MDSIVVTVRYRNEEADLDLPADLPISYLGPILAERLDWNDLLPQDDNVICSARAINSGVVMQPSETLAGAGIVHGETLELLLVSRPSIAAEEPQESVKGALLQSAQSGQVFHCRGRATLVGRSRRCNINLSVLHGSDVVSREHANIVRRRNGYWIKDEHSSNGTIVDGFLLSPGESVRVRNGSRIQFGEEGPILIFRHGPLEQAP